MARPPIRLALGLLAFAMLAGAAAAAPTPGETDADAAGDVIRMRSGATIEGKVLKRDDRRIWIDVGPTVIDLSMDDVESVGTADGDRPRVSTRAISLFSVADDSIELPPKEQARLVGPAVIKVSTPAGLGSGVIINKEGFAITNAHVVQGEATLRATVWLQQADGSLKRTDIDDVELIAVNNHVDLALVKMKHPEGRDFPFAPLARADAVAVGEAVFAIGNPLGLERTMTQGVVSTVSRNFGGLTYIQTDTPINPGNSGGPLFDTRGEVVGITNMGIMGGEALGFAIPARYVKDFVQNREAFAYDKNNPNSGRNYHAPPGRRSFGVAPQLDDSTSEGAKAGGSAPRS